MTDKDIGFEMSEFYVKHTHETVWDCHPNGSREERRPLHCERAAVEVVESKATNATRYDPSTGIETSESIVLGPFDTEHDAWVESASLDDANQVHRFH